MDALDGHVSEWLLAMPKAELHLHLDGSLRPETALALARERGLDDGAVFADVTTLRQHLVAPARCADQRELLHYFELPLKLLQDRAALERSTSELVEDVASDGTAYAEIRWAPALHTLGGLSLAEGIDAVAAAAAQAASRAGIEVRLIAVALRTQDPATALEVARTALDFLDVGLTGFDLAGPERDAPDPRVFAAAFDVARSGGLGITCHAGEWGGASQVRRALAIEPWRIAHGAPAADDADLMAELRRRGTTLDICPTSNLQIGIGRADPSAPLTRLVRAGVSATINTDDRTVSDVTLVSELEGAVRRLGLAPDEMVGLMRCAYAAAFLHHDEDRRSELSNAFEAWLVAHPAPT